MSHLIKWSPRRWLLEEVEKDTRLKILMTFAERFLLSPKEKARAIYLDLVQ